MLRTMAQYKIMELLKRSKHGMIKLHIARELNMTYSHVHNMIDELCYMKLVDVTRTEKNKRISIVKIAERRRTKW